MQNEAQIALGVRRVSVRPQQRLEGVAPMPRAGGKCYAREKLRTLLARKLDGSAVGIPQAKPAEQCDLEFRHGCLGRCRSQDSLAPRQDPRNGEKHPPHARLTLHQLNSRKPHIRED